jgi:hypothetical protein
MLGDLTKAQYVMRRQARPRPLLPSRDELP